MSNRATVTGGAIYVNFVLPMEFNVSDIVPSCLEPLWADLAGQNNGKCFGNAISSVPDRFQIELDSESVQLGTREIDFRAHLVIFIFGNLFMQKNLTFSK